MKTKKGSIRFAGTLLLLFAVAILQAQPAPPSPPFYVTVTSSNVTCNGACNGSATAVGNYGQPPYTFVWSYGPITDTVNSLCAGTYYVTGTDAVNDTWIDTLIITEPVPLNDTILSIVNVGPCYGGNNGSAIPVISGGVLPYSISAIHYADDGTGPVAVDSFTSLTYGFYIFTATDANGCIRTDSFFINQPGQIFNISNINICQGLSYQGHSVSGTWDDTLTALNGCDSIFRLNLQVNPVPDISLSFTPRTCVAYDTLILNGVDSSDQVIWWSGDSVVNSFSAYAGVTVAGGNGSGSGANQFEFPEGVFVDRLGNIYVTDSGNSRVQKWAPGATSGVTVAGGNGDGSAANQLSLPSGVYVDDSGAIYVSDVRNSRVQKWLPGATTGVTVAGGNGNGSAANQLGWPEDVFLDKSGNIYVSDLPNNRVQKWAPGATSGITITGDANNQLFNPGGIFVDKNENLYVIDLGHQRVQKFAAGDTVGVTVISQVNTEGIYVDSSGNIYLSGQESVGKYAPGSNTVITVAGGNGFGSAPNQLEQTWGVWLDAAGYIYVADGGNNRVQKWAPNPFNTLNYITDVPGTYKVIASNTSGCADTSNSIEINSLPSVCYVWPGDANEDGIVDNNDVLAIGLGYGYSGSVRPNASLVWVGQPAVDWNNTLTSGSNAKYADCDGNGTINADDTMAVTLNYSLTHLKAGSELDTSNPSLFIDFPPFDSTLAGQTIQVPVYLGSSAKPIAAISGIAFSINYNGSLLSDSTVQLSAAGSWMGTPGTNLLTFRQNIYSASRTDIALTRTDHTDVSGFGPLCTVSYIMKDDISGKSEISKMLPFSISGVTAMTSSDVQVPLSYGEVDTVIAYQYTGVSATRLSTPLRIYPNPASQYIIVDPGKSVVDQYIVTDLLGNEIKIINVKEEGPINIDVSQLTAGMYFLRARSGNNLTALKFSIVR